MLNKQKGNMYTFITHTWNVLKGKCPFDCEYCYMKRWKQKELKFDCKELKTDLGWGNFIFVGSSCDMFTKNFPNDMIQDVLNHCKKFDNKYLFQSKNPQRFFNFKFPKNTILGTTIETNRDYKLSKAPNTKERTFWLHLIKEQKKMVTIEPILDFDIDELIGMIKKINPKWVNIGADSQGHNLPEPSWDKIQNLIKELKQFTKVIEKNNLKRLKK